jgi:hypothetical protein
MCRAGRASCSTTQITMTTELVTQDPVEHRTKAEWRAAAEHWFGVATDMRDQRDTIAVDLERSLNLVHKYQKIVAMLGAPDPAHTEMRDLFIKYKMSWDIGAQPFAIFLDGRDITWDADSISGTADEMELESGEEDATLLLDE